MPRPFREWTALTCTISPEVDQFLRQQAATQGIDVGTVLDVIVWRNHLQPSDQELRGGKLPPEVIERCFAEEALALLETEKAVLLLDEELDIEAPPSTRRRKVQALVRRWMKTREIPKEFKRPLLEVMSQLDVVPKILDVELVGEEWF